MMPIKDPLSNMSTMDIKLLDENYKKLGLCVTSDSINKDYFLIKCNQVHLDGAFYFCSEQCHIRQQIRKCYQTEHQKIHSRWESFDKNVIDDMTAVYEKTFKEQLIGRSTAEQVHLALGALEEKISEFFEVIYCLIASMADHQNFFSAVRMYLTEEANIFFDVFEQTKHLMQEFLFRTVCVTDIDLVMIDKLQFKLKLSVCPFVIKSRDSSNLRVPGAVEDQHVYDHGTITSDFKNFYLKPAAESYDLRMPGVTEVTEVTEANEKKRGGKRARKMKVDNTSICPLERNVRAFVLSKSVLEADFSKIKLEATSKDEQELRKRLVNGNQSQQIPVSSPGRDVGVFEKIKRKVSGQKRQTHAAVAASVELNTAIAGKDEQIDSVSELLNYIIVTVAIQFPGVSFNFFKKIKVPVAVLSNANQRPDGYGSAVWNLIVWLEEANRGNYQWDWPQPYGVVQREVSDTDYPIDHQHFVETYLNGLITVLARVKPEESPKQLGGKPTDKDEFVDNLLSVETFLSDEDFSVGSNELRSTDSNSSMEPKLSLTSNTSFDTSLSDEDLANIPDDLLSIDPSNLKEFNHILSNGSVEIFSHGTTKLKSTVPDNLLEHNHCRSEAGSNPRIPRNLNDIQLDFLSRKLRNLSISEGFVTRSSFLKMIAKDTRMSLFRWFFSTCQAIGKNFGIKAKKKNWFGDPTKSVWLSDFVIGYIDESQADAALQKFPGEDHLLLIRFSGSESHSVVIHMTSGPYGPVQRSPVAVGPSQSLATILRNPLFTPNYKIVIWNSEGQFVLKPILAFYDWVAQAVSSGSKRQTDAASTAKGGRVSPTSTNNLYPKKADDYDQIKLGMDLRQAMAKLNIKQNAAKDLYDLLTEVNQSKEESDNIDGPATKKRLREILSDGPELLRLIKYGADNTETHERPLDTNDIAESRPTTSYLNSNLPYLNSIHYQNNPY